MLLNRCEKPVIVHVVIYLCKADGIMLVGFNLNGDDNFSVVAFS